MAELRELLNQLPPKSRAAVLNKINNRHYNGKLSLLDKPSDLIICLYWDSKYENYFSQLFTKLQRAGK